MIALYSITLLAAGSCLGWFAHRAYVGFFAWANAMKQQYAGSHPPAGEQFDRAPQRVRVLRFEDHEQLRSERARLAHE